MQKNKDRQNERTMKFQKESERRFLIFWGKCQSLSLGSQNYIKKTLEVFANAQKRLEGILFFELVKEKIVENDMTYKELAEKIDSLHRDMQLKPGEHVYSESHLRVAIKRRNYKSIVTGDLKKIFSIKEKHIKKDFLSTRNDYLDYLRFAFISLDKATQTTFLQLADNLYYMEKHIEFAQYCEDINDMGMYSKEKAKKVMQKQNMRKM